MRTMGYYIDLTQISIDQYKKVLKSADLLPSWMILKNNIDENLEAIKKQGIRNIEELKIALKTKQKVLEFAQRSGLSEQYLTILRRVINGYHPKPNKIKDFPGIQTEIAKKLESLGIKNTLQLYDHILTDTKRKKLSDQTGIQKREIEKLAHLTDLSRIKWVNHTFANALLEAGFDCVEKVAKADPDDLFQSVKKVNQEKQLYKGQVGVKDMKRCITAAKDLTLDIQY